MQDYLNSKVAEYSILLDWIEDVIEGLRTKNGNHAHLVKCLHDKIVELRELHKRLRIIAGIEDDRLTLRAMPIIHTIEYQIYILTYYYIPGLQRENTNDLFIRSLILSAKQRCGLSWVKDVLVRLDSPHATFLGVTEIPIIFAPPQQVASISDMTGIYHELGHDVFQRFKEIADKLAITVSRHFSELRQDVGPMIPEKREARNLIIKNAINYWDAERLNEIFSDIYATFVCGPAYYFSCVDIAIRMGSNPFRIEVTDVHPPWATRVYACYKTLLPIYQNEDVVISTQNIWNAYIDAQQKHPDFEIICPSALINQLVDVANQNIKQFLHDAQHFSEPIPDSSKLKEISPSETLESILNKWSKILLTEPENCAEWEKNVFKILQIHTRVSTS